VLGWHTLSGVFRCCWGFSKLLSLLFILLKRCQNIRDILEIIKRFAKQTRTMAALFSCCSTCSYIVGGPGAGNWVGISLLYSIGGVWVCTHVLALFAFTQAYSTHYQLLSHILTLTFITSVLLKQQTRSDPGVNSEANGDISLYFNRLKNPDDERASRTYFTAIGHWFQNCWSILDKQWEHSV